MSERTRYFRVGLFVLVGLFVIGAFAVTLGGRNFFAERILFETYFDEPVTGLEVGSPVRLRGVPIGNVKSIGMVEDFYAFESEEQRDRYGQRVSVLMERVIGRDEEDELVDLSLEDRRERLERMVERGLRLRLSQSGITGTAFIQADFLDPERFPAMKLVWEPRHLYIPSAPSTIATLTSAAERLAARVENVDFEQLVEDVSTLLVALTREAEGLHVAEMRSEATSLLAELRETNRQLQVALAGADLPAVGASGRRALEEATATLARTRGTLEGGRYDLEAALENLRVATENLRDLTETVRGQPSLLLRGEPPPRTVLDVERAGEPE